MGKSTDCTQKTSLDSASLVAQDPGQVTAICASVPICSMADGDRMGLRLYRALNELIKDPEQCLGYS